MSVLQLLVARRGLDPAAWTALDTLRRLGHPARALARASLWEFDLEGTLEGETESALRTWVASANRFANPNRDHVHWRTNAGAPSALAALAVRADGGLGVESAALDGHLVTFARDGAETPEHAEAASRRLGRTIAVRHGTVWAGAAEHGSARAWLEAAGGGGAGGLLANPHAERARLAGRTLPLPALVEETRLAGRAGGEEEA